MLDEAASLLNFSFWWRTPPVTMEAPATNKRFPMMEPVRLPLTDADSHRAPASRFRDELEDNMSEEFADQTLRAVTSWGRYGEAFAYDEASGVFSLDNPT